MFNIETKYTSTSLGTAKSVIAELQEHLFNRHDTYLVYYDTFEMEELLGDKNDVEVLSKNFSSALSVCNFIVEKLLEDERTLDTFRGILERPFIKKIENSLSLLDYVIFDIRSYITENESAIFRTENRLSKAQRTKVAHSSIIIESALNILIDREKNGYFENIPISLFLIRQYMDIRIKEIVFGKSHTKKNKIDIREGILRLESQGMLTCNESKNLQKILRITNDYAHHAILPYYWIALEAARYASTVLDRKRS